LDGVGFIGRTENHPVVQIQREHCGFVFAERRDERWNRRYFIFIGISMVEDASYRRSRVSRYWPIVANCAKYYFCWSFCWRSGLSIFTSRCQPFG
jgi:hypothetical protein